MPSSSYLRRNVNDRNQTSKVVYDDVVWNDNKVRRRVPSCLDVAFAALANDHVVPELAEHLTNTRTGRQFRQSAPRCQQVIAREDCLRLESHHARGNAVTGAFQAGHVD